MNAQVQDIINISPTAQGKRYWDEHTDKVNRRSKRWATSDRGWLFIGGLCYGHYLDYGADHFRSSHEWCRGDCTCPESQPGAVHAVRFHRVNGQPSATQSRYFVTVAEAKTWIDEYNPAI